MRPRNVQRGKQLEAKCYHANTTKWEFGASDDRVFCYGVYGEYTADCIDPECLECGAYVYNAEQEGGTDDRA